MRTGTRHPYFPVITKNSGYVLVSVIWLLLVGVTIASYLASWVQGAIEQGSVEVRDARYLQDSYSTRSIVTYLLTTQRMTVSGLTTEFVSDDRSKIDDEGNWTVAAAGNEIRLDGRVYRGRGNVLFTLQDQRGLLNLNNSSDILLQQYLRNRGVEQHHRAIAALNDYKDADDLYRFNGAEKPQYEAQGLPGPSNAPLRSVMEIHKVLGWQEIPSTELVTNFTVARDTQMNLNSAPGAVLRSLPTINVAMSQHIEEMREFEGIGNRNLLASRLGLTSDDIETYVLFPSRYLGLTLWNSRLDTSRTHFTIKSLPHDPRDKPWAVLESFTYSHGQGIDAGENQSPLELPPSAQALLR